MRASMLAAMAALAIQPFAARGAESTPLNWQIDCVGRMQISLPGAADVGAHTAKSWLAERKDVNVPMRFPDETIAGWSGQTSFFVSHALSENELTSLYQGEAWTKDSFTKEVASSPRFPYVKNSFRTYSTAPLDGSAWSYEIRNINTTYRQVMLVRLGHHLIRWSGWAGDEDAQHKVQQNFERTKRNLQFRPLFTVPASPGVCYPYLFLNDDNDGPWSRGVASTYRLKDHPDITIWLSDSNAAGRVENETSRHQGARYNAEFFWRTDYRKYRVLTYLFSLPTRFPATRMAGYPGVESYVKLTREDGTLDYGYLVSVRGDPDAKQDEPDLMLYVIRDAAEARARGLEPYGDEKTFLALARSIAATVKRRPVAAGTAR